VERRASGALTTGAPRAGARDMRASRAGPLAEGQRQAIRASFSSEKSCFHHARVQDRSLCDPMCPCSRAGTVVAACADLALERLI
jgi:hypothetical protein